MGQRRLLSAIMRSLSGIPGVLAVVLYGSFARGDYGPKSDVDILVIVRMPAHIQRVRQHLAEQSFERPIQPTIRSLDQLSKTDTGLMQNIFRQGKLLFLKESLDLPASTLLDLRPFTLYTFGLHGMTQPQKARFNRLLYPRRAGKRSYPGLIDEVGGSRLSAGCFMVPQSATARIERLMEKNKAAFQSRHVWL